MRSVVSGFSLVEILIAAGVSLLLGVVFFKVFVPATSHSARGTTRLELRQFAMLAYQQIQSEISQTKPGAVSGANSALVTHPYLALDGGGLPVWSDEYTVFCVPVGERELGKYQLAAGAARPSRFLSAQLPGLMASLPAPSKIVASFVEEFKVTLPTVATASTPSEPLEIGLVMEKDIPGDERPVRLAVHRKFAYRSNN